MGKDSRIIVLEWYWVMERERERGGEDYPSQGKTEEGNAERCSG